MTRFDLFYNCVLRWKITILFLFFVKLMRTQLLVDIMKLEMVKNTISLKYISQRAKSTWQMICHWFERIPMQWKEWECETFVFSYTYDVIGVFSVTFASIDVIGLAVSNFNWGGPMCSQGTLCTFDVIGVSSVLLLSFNVVGPSVSNFSWGDPIFSQGLLCTSAVDCSLICLARR